MFAAGFSLPSNSLQRVFAIVELLRAVAAFMIAPVFAHLALTVAANPRTGTTIALWIGLAMALGGAGLAVGDLPARGSAAETPRLERFIAQEGAAWYSPPLLAAVRGRSPARAFGEEPALEINGCPAD